MKKMSMATSFVKYLGLLKMPGMDSAMESYEKSLQRCYFDNRFLWNPKRQQQFLVGLSFPVPLPILDKETVYLIDSGNQSNKTSSNSATKRLEEAWLKI